MRIAINLAHIKNSLILLVKKKEVWILPGGKPEPKETNIICLKRECAEEIPLAKIVIGKKYKNFVGMTPHKGDLLVAKVYFGKVIGIITPSAEISESSYFSAKEALELNLSEITKKIIDALIHENYL